MEKNDDVEQKLVSQIFVAEEHQGVFVYRDANGNQLNLAGILAEATATGAKVIPLGTAWVGDGNFGALRCSVLVVAVSPSPLDRFFAMRQEKNADNKSTDPNAA